MDEGLKPRLRKEERMVFDLIEFPKRPRLHVYMSIFIGALLVAYDLYSQLPKEMPKDMSDLSVDPNTWYAYPFLLLAMVIEDKRMYRMVCDGLRSVSDEHNMRVSDIQMQGMADHAMVTKLAIYRVVSALLIIFMWFIAFNLLMMPMLFLKDF